MLVAGAAAAHGQDSAGEAVVGMWTSSELRFQALDCIHKVDAYAGFHEVSPMQKVFTMLGSRIGLAAHVLVHEVVSRLHSPFRLTAKAFRSARQGGEGRRCCSQSQRPKECSALRCVRIVNYTSKFLRHRVYNARRKVATEIQI